MFVKAIVIPSCYQDSVVLMRVAGELRQLPQVQEAGLFMGTEANLQILQANGLYTPACAQAAPGDMVMAVRADTEEAAEGALQTGQKALLKTPQAEESTAASPRTLESALQRSPTANLAFISLPGQYAAEEAHRALALGLHVFLFSDNVPLADEIQLKKEAVARNLLCMGPDCGSACLNGVRLGFMNAVPAGRVGLVASSGTGLQAVACHLAAMGEGLSQAVGVGGRDMSAAVGGLMTLAAVQWLAASPATEALVIITKHADDAVLAALDSQLAQLQMPVVFCGLDCTGTLQHARCVDTLDEAAQAVVRALNGTEQDTPPPAVALPADLQPCPKRRIVGLYTGGTLAGEARRLMEKELGQPVAYGKTVPAGHMLLDLGDDAFTVGRPHPMLDPSSRNLLLSTAQSPDNTACFAADTLTVLLFDLVLGDGAHLDPAPELVRAIVAARNIARSRNGDLLPVCCVIGTEADKQSLHTQKQLLEEVGVVLFSTNAAAVRFALQMNRNA